MVKLKVKVVKGEGEGETGKKDKLTAILAAEHRGGGVGFGTPDNISHFSFSART